jgi:hypothetical protein
LLPIVIGLSHLIADGRLLDHAARVFVVFCVMAACIAPWTVRNYRLFGEYILISHNGGANTWQGNSPGTTGEYRPSPPDLNSLPEPERDRVLGARAFEYIKAYPLHFLGRSAVKLVKLHNRESIGIVWNEKGLSQRASPGTITVMKMLSVLYWWIALGLGLCGAFALARTIGPFQALFHPAILIWGYFSAVHAVTVVGDRYHFPSIPSIAALGGFFLARMLGTMPQKKGNRTGDPTGSFDL